MAPAPGTFAGKIMAPVNSKSFFGYDTRSVCNALIMRAIDLLNPFNRPRPFFWHGPVVAAVFKGAGAKNLAEGITHGAHPLPHRSWQLFFKRHDVGSSR